LAKKHLNRTVNFLIGLVCLSVLFGILIVAILRLLVVLQSIPPFVYVAVTLIIVAIFILKTFFDVGLPGDY